jgi:hypothetical protein
MNIAKVISTIGLLAMTAVLGYAFTSGSITTEGAWLLAHPWGQVSLIDVYVGFALFSGWVVYRENSMARSLLWIVLIIVLGNWSSSLYALLALISSRGDWKHFWMGNRAYQ